MSKAFENYLYSKLKKYKSNDVIKAMSYALDGGKRFRPNVIFAIAKGFGLKERDCYPAAAALEYIQTYSLIHDDMPCMDNDDYRRGKLSTHKKFGEDIGLLSGDALLTHSFAILADPKNNYSGELVKNLTYSLSIYSGLGGMIYGQLLDIQSKSKINKKQLFEIQDNKTSGLFKYCCIAGMYLGKNKDYKYFEKLGSMIGVVFQNQDDLFDAIRSEKEMGKSLSDKDNDKLTALSYMNIEQLEKHIDQLFKELNQYLDKAPFNSNYLKDLLNKMKKR